MPGVDGVGRLDDARRIAFLLPRAPFGGMAVEATRVVPLADVKRVWAEPDGGKRMVFVTCAV